MRVAQGANEAVNAEPERGAGLRTVAKRRRAAESERMEGGGSGAMQPGASKAAEGGEAAEDAGEAAQEDGEAAEGGSGPAEGVLGPGETPAAEEPPTKQRRGRPPGKKNARAAEAADEAAERGSGPGAAPAGQEPPAKKRRGRPPGKKTTPSQSAPVTPGSAAAARNGDAGDASGPGRARGRGRSRGRGRARGNSGPAAPRHSQSVWAPAPSEIGSIAHRVHREHRRRESTEPDTGEDEA